LCLTIAGTTDSIFWISDIGPGYACRPDAGTLEPPRRTAYDVVALGGSRFLVCKALREHVLPQNIPRLGWAVVKARPHSRQVLGCLLGGWRRRWLPLLRRQPQDLVFPALRARDSARMVFPQSQAHSKTTWPRLLRPSKRMTVKCSKRCPVRSI
jgi:hypothetical protein